MAFNINDISSAINRRGGLAKPSHFLVHMPKLPNALQYNSYGKREAMFFCDTAVLPGMNYSVAQVKPLGYGVSEPRPIDVAFAPVDLTFMIDNDGKAIDFFQKWAAMIYNFAPDTRGLMQGSGLRHGEFNYPSEYEGVVEIYYYSTDGNQIIKYTLINAFPSQIGNVSVGWEQNDQYARLPIAMSYKSWDTEAIPASEMDSEESMRADFFAQSLNRPNVGGLLAFGLNLLQNGRRSPLSLISNIGALAGAL